MAAPLPRLPIGIQTFEKIRQANAVYVDKTGYLPGLSNLGGVVFCARPRRFGKSLTVSTLDAFHSGRKELFSGLAAEEYLNSPEFRPRPVIRLDMSSVAGSENRETLDAKIRNILKFNADRYNLTVGGGRRS